MDILTLNDLVTPAAVALTATTAHLLSRRKAAKQGVSTAAPSRPPIMNARRVAIETRAIATAMGEARRELSHKRVPKEVADNVHRILDEALKAARDAAARGV